MHCLDYTDWLFHFISQNSIKTIGIEEEPRYKKKQHVNKHFNNSISESCSNLVGCGRVCGYVCLRCVLPSDSLFSWVPFPFPGHSSFLVAFALPFPFLILRPVPQCSGAAKWGVLVAHASGRR